MKINAVDIPAVKGTAAGKKSSSSDFGDILDDFEEKGGAAQILAAFGFMFQMPVQTNTEVQGQQAAQNAQQVDTVAGDLTELAQMVPQGILITGKTGSAAGNDFSNLIQNQAQNPDATAAVTAGPNSTILNANAAVLPSIGGDTAAQSGNSAQPAGTAALNIAGADGLNISVNGNYGAQAGIIATDALKPQTLKNSSPVGNLQNSTFSAQLNTAEAGVHVSSETVPSQSVAAEASVNVNGEALSGEINGTANQNSAISAVQKSVAGTAVKTTDAVKNAESSVKTVPVSEQAQQITAALKKAESTDTDSAGGGDDKSDQKNDSANLLAGASQVNKMETKDIQRFEPSDKANAANQVADAVKQAVDNGRNEVRIHLSPEDLGGISVKIISQGGSLSLQITADNQHTGQLLASGMHELQKSLQDNGITMNKAEVSYTGLGGFSASTSQQQQQQQQQNFSSQYNLPKWVPAMQNTGSITAAPAAARTEPYSNSDSGLSILA
ncbi:MAG TPA: flagellar hook-length control protein FliK [Ruminiclostridium sp.]|nr:flagellar hook-length control protein FliK [Ruminiclostridium sp.]